MAEDLKREFDRRRPWVTKFVIQGREYGGHYDAANDSRLKWFQQDFPDAQTILELGSLEGGHSFALAALPHVKRVIAAEGRPNNLRRAQFVQGLLGQEKVDFISANLENSIWPAWVPVMWCSVSGYCIICPSPGSSLNK
jgi:hypothetical protein